MSESQNGGKKMERLTTRDANCADPKVLYGVWVRNHDYISAANRLADYEDTGMTPEEVSTLVKDWSDLCTIVGECGGLDRVRELAEADKEGRVVVLPFTSGRTLLCKENIDSPRLMKDVELAIRYCSSCGIVFHMGYNVFCDLVKHGRITAVSEEAEKALEALKDGNG